MMKQLLVDTTDVFGTANRSYISSQQARTASSNLGENTEPAWTKVLIFETYSNPAVANNNDRIRSEIQDVQ